MFLSIVYWIVLGLIVSFFTNKIVAGRGKGIVADIILGAFGAVIGGTIFLNVIEAGGAAVFNVWSLFPAVIGAIVFLVLWHGVMDPASQT